MLGHMHRYEGIKFKCQHNYVCSSDTSEETALMARHSAGHNLFDKSISISPVTHYPFSGNVISVLKACFKMYWKTEQ